MHSGTYTRWSQSPRSSTHGPPARSLLIEGTTPPASATVDSPHCTGSVTLEVVFGSPDNLRSKELIFDIVPFRSGYHALLGRTAFAKFNTVPHYAYLKLKMPGPRGVITVNGNTERSLRTEEHTAALAAEVQSSLLRQFSSPAAKQPDTAKRAQSNIQQDHLARSEHA